MFTARHQCQPPGPARVGDCPSMRHSCCARYGLMAVSGSPGRRGLVARHVYTPAIHALSVSMLICDSHERAHAHPNQRPC
jgi:hypothetical protein